MPSMTQVLPPKPSQVSMPEVKSRQHILTLSWDFVHTAVDALTIMCEQHKWDRVIGISRGGLVPATMISHRLNVPLFTVIAQSYEGTRRTLEKPTEIVGWQDEWSNRHTLVVDDIFDTGQTIKAINRINMAVMTISLVSKEQYAHGHWYFAHVDRSVWVHFPWEPKP
jgi:xanthine phosphoribosyltransferase